MDGSSASRSNRTKRPSTTRPTSTFAAWPPKSLSKPFTHSSSSSVKSAQLRWRRSPTANRAASDLSRSIARNQPQILWRASKPTKSTSLLVVNSLKFSSIKRSLPAGKTMERTASSPTSLSRTSQLALTTMDLPQCLQSTERSSLLKFSSTKTLTNLGTAASSALKIPKPPKRQWPQ